MIELYNVEDEAVNMVVDVLMQEITVPKAILFGGDRWRCVDEVAVARRQGELAGIATISYRGEQEDGKPTLVGVYVFPEHRLQGVGTKLTRAALARMLEQVSSDVHITLINSNFTKVLNKIELNKRVIVRNCVIASSADHVFE